MLSPVVKPNELQPGVGGELSNTTHRFSFSGQRINVLFLDILSSLNVPTISFFFMIIFIFHLSILIRFFLLYFLFFFLSHLPFGGFYSFIRFS